MTGLELIGLVIGLAYAAANIGLLCSIKFDQGAAKQQASDHERRIGKLEGKVA